MEAQKTFLQRIFSWFGSMGEKTPKAEPNVPLDYIAAVNKLADERTNRRFLNYGDNFACLVAWLMIRDARNEDEVLIYSKALSFPFYSRILRASSLSDSKPVFRIILDKKEGMEVIKKLPEGMQSRIECRLATTKDGSHILVTPVAFRAEIKDYHDELDVVCNFYEPYVAQILKARFERIWANAVPIPATE